MMVLVARCLVNNPFGRVSSEARIVSRPWMTWFGAMGRDMEPFCAKKSAAALRSPISSDSRIAVHEAFAGALDLDALERAQGFGHNWLLLKGFNSCSEHHIRGLLSNHHDHGIGIATNGD